VPSDEFIAHSKGKCVLLNEIGWKRFYGTTAIGNLPQMSTDVCGIEDDFKYNYYCKTCPYSTNDEINKKIDTNPFSATYKQLIDVEGTSVHTTTSGSTIKTSRGSKYGWTCMDDNCYYYTTVEVGKRYFML